MPPKRSSLTALFAFIAASAHATTAQAPDAAQRQFAEMYVAAIKSQDADKVKALFHPATIACLNAGNRDYFDFAVKDELETGSRLGATYEIRITPLSEPAPLGDLPEDGFIYPIQPTHELQIDAETADHHPMVLVRFLAPANGHWYAVDPCPNAKGLHFFEQQRAEGDRQRALGLKLAAAMPPSLREEIKQLLAQGRWIDALNRYRDATGADLETAATVVDAIGK